MIFPKTIYKCTRLKIYTGRSSYYYYLHGSKCPHHVYVSWMLFSRGLSSFWAHYWPLTKRKVLGSAANASHRPLYQSRVVQNHSVLGIGVYFWSWITQIHTLAPSCILLHTLVLQCLANALVIKRRKLGASEEFLLCFSLRFIHCAQHTLLDVLDLSAIRWFSELPY